ncbi:Phosphoglycerate mutase family [Rubrivivax sp. A210]|uniref:histidine phosphatase family protein n=1 Tax=Rubrivivax sp. A210 TaxID=2772301 RepID=UPI00191B74C4|nr:histidine phosphatase family protein [Rubrivivax sp. A210]CAD5371830.1 Phosphoglycerate mutase family [Rubrivivax sp. A210]
MQEPTRLFALRHGQTAWNADRRIQGHVDIPLDDTGSRQAALLAQALAGEGLAAIYSSDLQRARATADALAAATGLAVQTEPALRERAFGRFESLAFTEIEERWPEEALRWRRREPDFAPGGGETLEVFAGRCLPAIAALAARHAGQAIAVVSHGGVLDCLYRHAVGIAPAQARTWQLGNASINRLLYNGEGFVVVGWNDDAHLEGA